MSKPDLVSCLCITRGRPLRLRAAVAQFRRQTYPNKELIIVVDPRGGMDDEYRQIASELDSDGEISMLKSVVERNVAGLRNFSVGLSSGTILATWDDDDLYHPMRLEKQVDWLLKSGVQANYLQHGGMWFEPEKKLYLVHYDVFGMAPSMVAWKKGLPEYQETEVRPGAGEKSSDGEVQRQLYKAKQTSMLPGHPWLYIRVFHGKNMWDRAHLEHMVRVNGWPADWIRSAEATLMGEFGKYFPGKLPTGIYDSDDNLVTL